MDIKVLKENIENGKIDDSILIFLIQGKDNTNQKFLSIQYAKAVAHIKNVNLSFMDSFENTSENLFEDVDTVQYDNYRYLFIKDLEVSNDILSKESRLIICTESIKYAENLDAGLKNFYESRTITIPTIEEWHIMDLILSRAPGLTKENASWLMSYCNKDLFRVDMELDKLSLFLPYEQSRLIKEFQEEGIYEDITDKTIFDFSNALSRRDIDSIAKLYKYKDALVKPGSEMGFLYLLFKTFKNLILVKTSNTPTPNTTGLSQKQIMALQYIPNVFGTKKLLETFDLIAGMDSRIKNGEFDTTVIDIVDYLIIKILMETSKV